jgi:dTDP-glucose 4,6-dehydratase
LQDTIIVTGGAGFIGSNFVLRWLKSGRGTVANLDRLTYAGNMENLASVSKDPKHLFFKEDINDHEVIAQIFRNHTPMAVVHFAAESHVDRSIHSPGEFITSNINGTFNLLQAARGYHDQLPSSEKSKFRFVHVSTDEVYGSLGPNDPAFTEEHAYEPNSPYSASKAASDHLARAFHHTYGLPVIITNCSNNYGPYQFPEKLIPLMILNASTGKPLPVYGDGLNVRDWLFVEDHCDALMRVLENGKPGETYNIGGNSERTNMQVVEAVCAIMDERRPASAPHNRLITFVKDRPGHDRRYAVDTRKIKRELGWKPAESFETGIRKTIDWYMHHQSWVQNLLTGQYREWIDRQYPSAKH